MFKIIQKRKIFFTISSILVLASILSLIIWGLNLGIDFTGGSLLEIEVKNAEFTAQQVTEVITNEMAGIGEVKVQPTEDGFFIRSKELTENQHQNILSIISSMQVEEFEIEDEIIEKLPVEVVEKRFESIGPVIGQELKTKALWAIGVALIVIVLFIAWSFRKVSKPVQSWKYGIGAIVALAHDVLIVTGVFAVLGHFLNIEVGILFVTALLTILGYSVNDTIVVFDRTRENLIYNPQDTFENTVNKSVNETIGRSINTSLTTLLVLAALLIFGGATISNFVLTLMIGVGLGTYSSIFIASPLLVVWQKLKKKR